MPRRDPIERRPVLALLATLSTACPTSDSERPIGTDHGVDPTTSGDSDGSTGSTGGSPTDGATTVEPDSTTTDGTTGELSSTTGQEPSTSGTTCGDGVLDDDEDCDDGRNNADYGPCTTTCNTAYCGDGLLWAVTEECDLGDLNGEDGSGCSADCTALSFCGDGERDPTTEECDEGDANGAGLCTKSCELFGQVVFVTSDSFNGDLKAYASMNGDGIDGADAICQARAAKAHLRDPGAFMAWISADAESAPANRYPGSITMSGPFILPVEGIVVADDWSELTSGVLQHAIDRTELGEPLADARVWTNTTPTGELSDAETSCEGWSSASLVKGRTGRSSEAGSFWTELAFEKCNVADQHLYCIEMPEVME